MRIAKVAKIRDMIVFISKTLSHYLGSYRSNEASTGAPPTEHQEVPLVDSPSSPP
jgi:hypothetical protein